MSIVFSKGKIGDLELDNRIVQSATYEGMATREGLVTDQLIKRYETLAKGEVGLVIPGYMSVSRSGRAHATQTNIDSDDTIPGLKRLVDAVHRHSGKIVIQIAHAGRQTTKAVTGQRPMGPSSFDRDPVNLVKPREMNDDDIKDAINDFASAARRAMEAGADGVQLHGAHGYLINQFLSPFFNRRTDSWGGSEEGRFRFLQEVYTAVRRAMPDNAALLIKLNTHDHTSTQGVTPQLALSYARRLAEMGIDAIEISSGTAIYSFMDTCRGDVPVQMLVESLPFWKRPLGRMMMKKLVGKYDLVEGYHLDAAKSLKPVMGDVPLILVGGMRRLSHMEEVLNEGAADFISMSRPFVREPSLVKRLKSGKTDRASCVSCNRCFACIASGVPLKCGYRPGN